MIQHRINIAEAKARLSYYQNPGLSRIVSSAAHRRTTSTFYAA